MREPCMCGAEDCRECFPGGPAPERDDCPDEPEPYRASDKDNEWMDYVAPGYRDAPC